MVTILYVFLICDARAESNNWIAINSFGGAHFAGIVTLDRTSSNPHFHSAFYCHWMVFDPFPYWKVKQFEVTAM